MNRRMLNLEAGFTVVDDDDDDDDVLFSAEKHAADASNDAGWDAAESCCGCCYVKAIDWSRSSANEQTSSTTSCSTETFVWRSV